MKYSLPILFLLFSPFCYSQEKKDDARRDCKKTFILKGTGNDGTNKQVRITLTKRFYDFSAEGLATQNNDDKTRYAGNDYVKIGEPTQKQDCAGYVFEKLWNKGEYWMTSGIFYDSIIKNFGKKISGSIGWGDVQKGDVAIYIDSRGVANHITIVKEVSTTLGATTSVIIETKDGKEGVFRHTLPPLTSIANDPLILAMGTPVIYRLNPSEVSVQEVNNGECDVDFSKVKGAYVLKRAVVEVGSTEVLKVDESTYSYLPPEGGYVFKLLNKPPAGINSLESFSLNFSATNNRKEPLLNEHTVIMWSTDTERFPAAADRHIKVGRHEGKIITEDSGTVIVKVPKYSGKELTLSILLANDYGRYSWVDFVYEKR